MSYQHFSTNERGRIEELKSLGLSHRAIGKRLGRHHSSIDREISRNVTSGKYSGEQAQAFYEKRRRNSVKHSGCTAEALSELVRFFFEDVGVNRIESKHDPRNPNSGKVMLKCGLKYEGTMRQDDINYQGVCDSVRYAIIAEEYFGKNNEGKL